MKKYLFKALKVVTGMSLALLCSCSGKPQPKETDSAISVRIDTVHVSDAGMKLEYVGIIEEKSSVALGFSVIGTIESITVSEGEFVRKGRLLAKLDQSSARSMLDAAEATLKQAQDAYKRLKTVHDNGSLPEIQMVDIETKLQQAQSSYDLARRNFNNCSLYAPSDGVIGKKMAEAGEFASPGKTILTLLDISSVKVAFSVPENEISGLTPDCRSEITVAAIAGRKFEGRIIEKGVKANPVSHTYPANVTIKNPEKMLLPGMVCKIELTSGTRPEGIVVPIGIIQTTSDGKKFVWCDRDGIAKRTFVTTGDTKGNGVVILHGLSEGDRIITAGYQKISEDDKITGK